MLVSGGPPIGSADQCDQNSQKLKFHSLNQSVIELDMQLEKFAQLQALQLNSCSNVPEEDAAAISHLIDEYSTQVSSFDERIKSIISVGLMKRKNTADILAAFEGLVHGKIDEDKMVIDTPCAPENCTPQRINSISNLKNVTPTIEQQQNGINFDDYPNTPTLEDLGLSRATLSLVGDRGFTKRTTHGRFKDARIKDSSGVDDDAPEIQTSFSTPRVEQMRSSSSLTSSMCPDPIFNNTLPASIHVHRIKDRLVMSENFQRSDQSTPSTMHHPVTSPFGGASSTIFGGRPSDTPSVIDAELVNGVDLMGSCSDFL